MATSGARLIDRSLTRLSLALCIAMLGAATAATFVGADAAAAGVSRPVVQDLVAPTAMVATAKHSLRAEIHVSSRAKRALRRCERRGHRGCSRKRREVRRASIRLSKLRTHLRRREASVARLKTKTSSSDLAAPTITVSGGKLSWSAVPKVSSYVFVRKATGTVDQYSVIDSNSIAPQAAPGQTVSYSVRTNVTGSYWATEVSVSYPATSVPTESNAGTESTLTTTNTEAGASSSPFEMGVVAGSALSYELPFIQKLGAHTARLEFEIGTPASQIAPIVEAYVEAGVRPLLLASFYGTLPSPTEAAKLGAWAAEFGPNGSLWQGRSFPANAGVPDIEFGNETSYSYQYSNDTTSGYASRAQTYAERFAEAYGAVHTANPNVGLLAQGDPGNAGAEWVNNMFKAVPTLGTMVAGWTVHPYGPQWKTVMDEVLSTTAANGAPSSIPMYVTEWGLTTDNGRCLESNYGWNPCMTYAEAASTLSSVVSAMRATYGRRLASVYAYQAHDQAASDATTSFSRYFGALQSDGEPKGAYTSTVESLLSSNP